MNRTSPNRAYLALLRQILLRRTSDMLGTLDEIGARLR